MRRFKIVWQCNHYVVYRIIKSDVMAAFRSEKDAKKFIKRQISLEKMRD